VGRGPRRARIPRRCRFSPGVDGFVVEARAEAGPRATLAKLSTSARASVHPFGGCGADRCSREKEKDGFSWTQRTLGEGSGWAAFGAGLILNLPGIWYLDALKDIARADAGTATRILWILLFIVIMFALAEIPLIAYAVDPDGTRVRVQRFQAWLAANAQTIATWAAAAIGVYLTVKGIVGPT
jgi:Sap, sulfolipid-1-addressing protein